MQYYGRRGRVPWTVDHATRAAPLKQKMRAVVEWEAPQDLKGVRSFLGFANYYHRFVQGYAELASPQTHLTKKMFHGYGGPLNNMLSRN